MLVTDQSDEGIAGGRGDAAHVLLVPGDLDVSLIPPGGAPAVLDLIILHKYI